MSKGINKVIIVGNLGKDPEVKHTASGSAVANFTIATSESWTDKQTNEKVEKTEWHKCVAFQRLGEIVGEYLKKGSQVFIQGKIQTRKYTDKDGVEKYSTEIVLQGFNSVLTMIGGRGGAGEGAGGGFGGSDEFGQSSPMGSSRGGGKATIPARDLDDEVPF